MKTALYIALGIIVIAGLLIFFNSSEEGVDTQTGQNTDQMPVEPDNGIGDGAEPLEDPRGEISQEASAQIEVAESLEFLGLTEAEAEALAEENGLIFRVVERDGEPLAMTMDFRPGRINASIMGGEVVSYYIEGAGDL